MTGMPGAGEPLTTVHKALPPVEASSAGVAHTPPSEAGTVCARLARTGTRDQMRLSPRDNVDAERIALRTTDALIAPEDRYQRVVADLAAIRAVASDPGATGTFHSFGTHSLILSVTPEIVAAITAGRYTALDCLHEWYGGRRVNVLKALDMVIVGFTPLYHPRRIAEAYVQHPDVLGADPDTMSGGGDDITLCNESFGGTHRYLFHKGSGDCPAGCIDWAYRGYEVTEDGKVTRLAPWKRSSGVEGVTPQWVTPGCFRRP